MTFSISQINQGYDPTSDNPLVDFLTCPIIQLPYWNKNAVQVKIDVEKYLYFQKENESIPLCENKIIRLNLDDLNKGNTIYRIDKSNVCNDLSLACQIDPNNLDVQKLMPLRTINDGIISNYGWKTLSSDEQLSKIVTLNTLFVHQTAFGEFGKLFMELHSSNDPNSIFGERQANLHIQLNGFNDRPNGGAFSLKDGNIYNAGDKDKDFIGWAYLEVSPWYANIVVNIPNYTPNVKHLLKKLLQLKNEPPEHICDLTDEKLFSIFPKEVSDYIMKGGEKPSYEAISKCWGFEKTQDLFPTLDPETDYLFVINGKMFYGKKRLAITNPFELDKEDARYDIGCEVDVDDTSTPAGRLLDIL